jgi:FkbM family methyltransferase
MELTADIAIDPPGGWGRLRRCRHGLFLYNRNDVYVGRSLEVYGEYSHLEAGLLCSLARPGDVFIDAGANIGTITVPLANRVGPGGAGHAFEPQPLNFQMLCANLALNGLTNVSPHNAGLSDAAGEMSVDMVDPKLPYNYGDMRLSPITAETARSATVKIIDDLALPRCRLIKIDVQGMEPKVLAGATATIARCRPALFVENDDRASSPALIRLIRSLGYRLWWHLSPLFNPTNFRRHPEDIFGNTVSSNLLCLPAEGDLSISAEELLDDDYWPLD